MTIKVRQMKSKIQSNMYSISIISLILTFQISALQATCNKTFQMASSATNNDNNETLQALNNQVTLTNTSSNFQLEQQQQQQYQSYDNETSLLVNNDTNLTTRKTTTKRDNDFRTNPHDGIGPIDVKSFRLEYNKYKILSSLGITANMEDIQPSPQLIDDDLRKKLTASTELANQKLSGSRHKRSLSCDQVNGNKNACCLENFYVNFTYIGWDKWILYPAGYNANYCHGQCDLSHARYYHSTLLSKYSNIVSLCCSPKHMAPLRLLYIDEDNKVHQKSIPDMIVESCDCA